MDGKDDAFVELHRLAVDLAPCGLLVVDEKGRILVVNREVERMFHYERGELVGRSVDLLVPESTRSGHPGHRQSFFAAPEARPMGAGRDLKGQRSDGSEVPVEVGLNPIESDGRRLVLASVVDISARKRADQRFHAVIESAPSGMLMVDPQGRIVLVNREAERLFGWSRSELLGRPVEELVPERFRSTHPGHRSRFAGAPETRPMGAGRELFCLRKDGSEVPVEIGLRPLETEEGVFVLSSIVDVTERKRSETRLRESEERFRSLIEGVRDQALVMLDDLGRVEVWNSGAELLTGRAALEVTGKTLEFLYPPDELEAGEMEAGFRAARADGRWESEGWRVRADGSRFLAHAVLSAVRGVSGSASVDPGARGYALVMRDVTLERRLDERLRQAQKSEAIGTLASGIAHDFNNVLLGIRGYAELGLELAEGHDEISGPLRHVLAAAKRGARLVERILSFARGEESVLAPLSPVPVVAETVQLLRASLPASVEIHAHLDEATPSVLADATQLQQLVMNLATNAAQALGGRSGVIEVESGPWDLSPEEAAAHPDISPGLHARIRVVDDGPGIPEDVLERIFDPFFTTKPAGEGTGLGLSIVRGIVSGHHGSIEVRSRDGGGTTVEILLPVAEVDEAVASDGSAAEVSDPERAAVMYVEDERSLAMLARAQLERLGYRVSVYTSSLAALEEFRRRPAAWDAVITDNTMPRMSGLELAGALLRIRPDLPIMMVSGLASVMSVDELRARGIREVLKKPHGRDDLAAALERMLSGSPPGTS